MQRVILDTNIILASIHPNSKYSIIIKKLYRKKYSLLVTPEIFLEYEEKIATNFNKDDAEKFLESLMILPNLVRVATYFDFRLIKHDADDDKFVNCAIAGNAHYIVSNDKHYNILKSVTFPKLNVINIDEFMEILNQVEK